MLHEALIGLAADGGPRHSTALLPEVERAAAAAGGWKAVGLIGVGVGPGSFTGLRIAVATGQALGAALGVPVRGVCTLDAIALGLGELDESRPRAAILDARRGEAFAALYSAGGERLWGPLVETPAELAERLGRGPESALAGGSGAVRFRHELVGCGVEIPDDADPVHRVAARHVCALAAAGDEDSGRLAPIYLRPPDAERWRERNAFQRAD